MRQKNNYNGIDVAIVHYNTPELTAAAIRSLEKCTPGCKVTILDNSDKRPFTRKMKGVKVLNNRTGQLIDFDKFLEKFPEKVGDSPNGYGSAKHCYSIQWLIDYLDKPFILLDSDVLIMKDLSVLWKEDKAFVARVSTNTKKYGVSIFRATPFVCYINVPMIKEAGVKYFNPEYMWDMSQKMPNMRYDVGAWFLEDVKAHELPYENADTVSMALHLRHGSWGDKSWKEWLEENKELHAL